MRSAPPLPRLPWPGLIVLTLALAMASWGDPGCARAQTDAGERAAMDDPYLDPLGFERVDENAATAVIGVELRSTGETRRTSGRPLLLGSQEMYLRSAAVAGLFQAARLWQAPLQRLTIETRGQSFSVSAGSRLVVAGGQEILLPVPVLAADGDLWLPMTFIVDVLAPRTRQTVRWDPEERQLALGSASYNLRSLQVEELTRATALHLRATEPLAFRVSADGEHLVLRIQGAEIDPAAVSLGRPRGLARAVTSRQGKDHALVVVTMDDLVGRYRTYTRDDGREIVVVLEEEQVSALPDPVPRGRARMSVAAAPVEVSRALEIRRVVVDPGHGGGDVGAHGPGGVLEKDVNLGVARHLRTYLQRRGLSVVLTRDDDRQLGLDERAEIANTAGGDLFISLHCNSWINSGAHGLETYFLSPAKSEWSRSVEAAENQAGGGGTVGPAAARAAETEDVDFIVWELVQNRFIASSSDLAEVVQRGVSRDVGMPDRGVRQAGFRVLVGAYMPAVLVELGFLSHPEEERRLNSSRHQERLAQALGDAIIDFRDRLAHGDGPGGTGAGPARGAGGGDGDGGAGNDGGGDGEWRSR
ncbi:MAG: N-acetylmuramoyl-L-alanine amidase [Candidatus Krumholzibacteriia bacterium]